MCVAHPWLPKKIFTGETPKHNIPKPDMCHDRAQTAACSGPHAQQGTMKCRKSKWSVSSLAFSAGVRHGPRHDLKGSHMCYVYISQFATSDNDFTRLHSPLSFFFPNFNPNRDIPKLYFSPNPWNFCKRKETVIHNGGFYPTGWHDSTHTCNSMPVKWENQTPKHSGQQLQFIT